MTARMKARRWVLGLNFGQGIEFGECNSEQEAYCMGARRIGAITGD